MTNQIAPVKYIKQITTTSVAHVEGMKFVDEAGRLGIIDGNPLSDDFTSYLNAPTHWGFYYGSSGSIWIAIPYDSFATHGCEVNLYWRDTGEWHRGEAGQYTKIIPGNSTWWTAPIWTFIGEVILSDSLARAKANEYHTLYENKLQTGNFFQIARNSQLLEPSKENETFPLPSSPYTGKIPKWAPLMVLVVLTGLGFLWKRIKSS